jgi:predicted extracellular nuclease
MAVAPILENSALNIFNFMKNFCLVLFLSLSVFVAAASAQTLVPISQIQGDSNLSTMAGRQIATRGVITAISSRGFYIQTPDAEIDKDPKTSEGIYVFTNEKMPLGIAVGSLVEVAGTVTEYRPRSERYSLTITEITNPGVKILSKDNPLPAPVALTAGELSPQGKIDQMERFEGMRVKVDVLNVVGPTGGFEDRKTGEVKSDGVFFGVLPKTPRPFREPGMNVLTLLIDKLPETVPFFDMNPELLRVDSDALDGAKTIDVTAGATVKNLTGVVDYAFRAYTLFTDPNNAPAVEGNKTFVKASPAGERETSVGAFNIENFFDDEKNSDNVEKEEILTKERFQGRLTKASLAIRNVLSMPDVLGVVEVENLKVLKKLAEKINADAAAANQPNPKYEAYLEEGNDPRGIDVGFLVKTSKVKFVEAKQLGKDEKLNAEGAKADEKLYDRPPFLIRVEVQDAKNNQPLPLTVIVNHFKSYGGIDDEKDGSRVRQKRRGQAEWLANFLVERQKANPAERIVVTGDFNSFQFNDGYNDLIGILKGKSDPNVLVASKTAYQTGLINLADFIDAKTRYSYVFDGSAQILDHILINPPAQERALKFGYARVDADFPKVYANDFTRPERRSDHDAPIVYFSLDEIKPK